MAQREIKFREWDEERQRLYGGGLSYGKRKDYDNEVSWIFDHTEKILDGETEGTSRILEQYTGIKDKNGVEIYEGDIVLDRDGYILSEVKMSDGAWMMTATQDLLNDYATNVEIVGNIHEQPELLEAE